MLTNVLTKALTGIAKGAGFVALEAVEAAGKLNTPKEPKVTKDEKLVAAVVVALKEQGLVK